MQLVVLAHDTARRSASSAPLGAGVPTIDQAVPFQRSTRVLLPVALNDEPTA
jgi:hypothetical protein